MGSIHFRFVWLVIRLMAHVTMMLLCLGVIGVMQCYLTEFMISHCCFFFRLKYQQIADFRLLIICKQFVLPSNGVRG